MFITVLFAIARPWKQPKCLLTEEWINEVWYINTMEYYSTIKRNETEPFAEIRMDLDMLHRVKSEREKQILYIKVYMWN